MARYGQYLKLSGKTRLLKMDKEELRAQIRDTRFPLKDPLERNDKTRLVDFAWRTCFRCTCSTCATPATFRASTSF